jgi:probable F420-dependent oxidoreductase
VRFSIMLPLLRDPGSSDPFRPTFELAKAAEAAGFDTATVGHHHFMAGNLSDPLTFLAAIAARTESLRIGTTIFQLPIHHPLRVAEQAATLDELSGGRMTLGVGLGWWALEHHVHGGDFRQRGQRMEEALEILRLVWSQEETSYDGRFWSFPPLTVYPRPVQRSGPPLWVAGAAQVAIERAARLGDAWLCGPVQPLERVVADAELHRQACRELARPANWVLQRFSWIGANRSEVEDGPLAAYVRGLLKHWRRSVEDPDDRARLAAAGDDPSDIADLANERLLWGTPGDVIAQLERYRELAEADHVHVAFGAGLPGDAPQAAFVDLRTIRGMIERFGAEVIPALA